MTDEQIVKRRVAREILSMIEQIYFSEEYSQFRIDQGSNGQKKLIIKNIEETYLK